MPANAWYKLTHEIPVVGSGHLEDGSVINDKRIFEKLIKGNYLFISYYGKPDTGTLLPKFRIYQYCELLNKWAKGPLIFANQTISDTVNGETIMLEPILISPRKVAILLEECEEDAELYVSAFRAGGGIL